jgi:hypothetical protein
MELKVKEETVSASWGGGAISSGEFQDAAPRSVPNETRRIVHEGNERTPQSHLSAEETVTDTTTWFTNISPSAEKNVAGYILPRQKDGR